MNQRENGVIPLEFQCQSQSKWNEWNFNNFSAEKRGFPVKEIIPIMMELERNYRTGTVSKAGNSGSD